VEVVTGAAIEQKRFLDSQRLLRINWHYLKPWSAHPHRRLSPCNAVDRQLEAEAVTTTLVVLALASAATYGAADFIGGLSARRGDTMTVVFVSQGAGLLMLAVLLPMLPATAPAQADWMWGGVAGLTGGVGVALLYRALAVGRMAVIAPITAVCAVAVPVAVAIVLGERPGLQASVGIAMAIVAIVLVSQQQPPVEGVSSPAAGRSGVGIALASGVAIGLFFVSLARTNPASGLWPLLAARVVSVALFGLLLVIRRRSLSMARPVMMMATTGGILDMFANLLYLLAAREGPLTLVVTLASLYPASTVMLARVILNEQLTMRQWLGVVSALLAIVVIVGAS
jgi:uncharacterized membrane protein